VLWRIGIHFLKTYCLRLRFSGTASVTKSASLTVSSSETVVFILFKAFSASCGDTFPFFNEFAYAPLNVFHPLSRNSSATS